MTGDLHDLQTLTRAEYLEKHRVSRWRYDQFRRHYGLENQVMAMSAFPQGIAPALPPVLHYSAEETILIAADFHIPHHDAELAAALLKVAEQERADRLIICGDFLNEDVFFMGGNAKLPTMVSFKTELLKAREVLHCLLDAFPAITWLAGNHEQRLFRASKGELDMASLLGQIAMVKLTEPLDVSRVVVTDRDYVIVDHLDPHYSWRIAHGVGGTASSPAAAAVKKAGIYDINVAQGHDHLIGLVQTPNAKHLGWDIGCMLEPEWALYKSLNTNTYPLWNQGFGLLKNGRPTPFSRRWTAWDRYGLNLST